MKVPARRFQVALLLLLPVVGYAAYEMSRHLGRRETLRAAEDALRKREFREANTHLQAYLEARPDDSAARLLAAQTARRLGDFEEARKHLALYAKGHGSRETLGLEHSLLRLQQGDLREANTLLAFAEDNAAAPETPLILEAVFESLLNEMAPPYSIEPSLLKRADDATMAQLEQGIDRWLQTRSALADHVQGLVWRGRLRRVHRDHARALADFHQALALDANHFQARLHLAVAVFQQDPEESERHLRMLNERVAGDARLRLCLAVVSRVVGRLEQADRVLTEILAANPHDVYALLERGQLALDMQRPEEAISYLRQAVELAPNEQESNFALSRGLRLTGKVSEADTYHQRFLKLRAERDRERSKMSQQPAANGKSRSQK